MAQSNTVNPDKKIKIIKQDYKYIMPVGHSALGSITKVKMML
jgi:hypothetical protein